MGYGPQYLDPAQAVSRHLSYWEERAAVRHAPALQLPQAIDVLIVGAGLMGHWLAYFLSQQQPAVTILVVERDLIGYGASTRNAGFLSCGNISEGWLDQQHLGEAAVLHHFVARKAGMDIILQEFQGAVETFPCGSADFDPITAEKVALAQTVNTALHAPRDRPVFSRQVMTLGGTPQEVFFNALDCEVNPVQLLTCLHTALLQRRVHFGYGAEVVALGNGRAVVQLQTRTTEVRYGYAFLCTNAFAAELHPASRVQAARGQIIVTAPCTLPTTRVLGFFRQGYDYFRFVDGRLLVGGGRDLFGDQEATAQIVPTAPVREYLEQLAQRIAGPVGLRIASHWAGLMGFPEGAHGAVQALEVPAYIDSRTEVLAGFAGWGITLTPYLAQQKAAQW